MPALARISPLALDLAAAGLTAVALLGPVAALADWRGDRSAYLHALSDLREAHWMLEHRTGDAASTRDAQVALNEIELAIDQTQRAAAVDGREVDNHIHPDVLPDYRGRLHNADNLLQHAQTDLNQTEMNEVNRDLQQKVSIHIDAALQATERAIRDVDTGQ